MMSVIMAISERCKLSPFDVLQKDFDDFAFIVNYYLANDNNKSKNKIKSGTKKHDGIKRVRVNDDTATGHWF